MELLKDYLPQYVTSNAIALAVLGLAWRKPTAARICLGIIFLAASVANTYTAVVTPGTYLDYERFAVFEIYRSFIRGWFASHIQPMVLSIAAGQLFIGTGMFLNGKPRDVALIGAVMFSLAIMPLGVSSAFPCSLLLALASGMLLRRPRRTGTCHGIQRGRPVKPLAQGLPQPRSRRAEEVE